MALNNRASELCQRPLFGSSTNNLEVFMLTRGFCLIALLMLCVAAVADTAAPAAPRVPLPAGQPPNTDASARLRSELEAMAIRDQLLRPEIVRLTKALGHESPEVKALWQQQSKTDHDNLVRLLQLIEVSGWPMLSIVGDKAATGAFLVIQHADLDVQRKLLPALRKAANDGELKRSLLAMLEDRILVRSEKPQLYGTQVRTNPETKQREFFPIAEPDKVDERRAAMDLQPIAEYARSFGFEYLAPQSNN
jgi:hypothetical protein